MGDVVAVALRDLASGRCLLGAGGASAGEPRLAFELLNGAAGRLQEQDLDPWWCWAELQALVAAARWIEAAPQPEREAAIDAVQERVNAVASVIVDRFPTLEATLAEAVWRIASDFGAGEASEHHQRAVERAEERALSWRSERLARGRDAWGG